MDLRNFASQLFSDPYFASSIVQRPHLRAQLINLYIFDMTTDEIFSYGDKYYRRAGLAKDFVFSLARDYLYSLARNCPVDDECIHYE